MNFILEEPRYVVVNLESSGERTREHKWTPEK